MTTLDEIDAEGARVRAALNGAGAHAPADNRDATIAQMRARLAAAEREAARLRGCEAVEGDYVCGHDARAHELERDRDNLRATINNLRTRLTAALIELEQARGERREALALRDYYAARLGAAWRASASIPAPGGGPWSEPDREAYLHGYVSADDARAAGHPIPAAAGPAANGQPSPPDSTAPAGSGADPLSLRAPPRSPRGCEPSARARAWAASIAGGG